MVNASPAIKASVRSKRVTHGRGRAVLADAARGRGAEEIAAKAPYLLQRNPHLDQQIERRRRRGGVVLAVEHAHGVVKMADRSKRALAAGGAFVMMDRHTRHIHDLPAVLLDPKGPIEVLAVHKE